MNIPNHLTALAADINALLDREETNRADWVDIKLGLCRKLAEARADFKDDQGFGRWFADTIGSAIDRNDRAAYITMGAHLDVAREVLEKTERSSIRYICEQEFKPRFHHVVKPAPTTRPKSPQAEARDEKIVNLRDDGKSVADIAKETGLGERRVSRVIQDENLKREGAAQAALLDAPVTASMQEKLDAHKRKLEREFEKGKAKWEAETNERLRKEHVRWLEERVAVYKDKAKQAEAIIEGRKGVFAKKDLMTIKSCLHPDSRNAVSDAKLAEAFRLFSEAEPVLLKPERTNAGPPLPTYEEMMSNAAAYDAAQRAKMEKVRAAARQKKEAKI